MNIRDKFLWNTAILLGFMSIIWCSWTLYNINLDSNELLENYKKEQVGTDKKLQDIVSQLEDVYTYRKNIKFKIKDNPFDLSRVISSDSNGKGRRSKLWVSGIVNKPNGTNMAILNYMNKSINVVAGDSIAGGVIEHITTTTVTYMKNEQLYYFDLGVGNNIE